MLKKIFAPFASLTLTVILLGLSMVLIYAGTWAQIDTGIWEVQHKYFHSIFVWIQLRDLFPRGLNINPAIGFPWPGGYTIGVMLLVNLLAAHSLRFKSTIKDLALLPSLTLLIGGLAAWTLNQQTYLIILGLVGGVAFLLTVAFLHGKRAGVITIHLGLILLLLGEAASSLMQVEGRMQIDEGSYANYAEDIREAELAFVERGAGNSEDTHVVIPASLLKKDAKLSPPQLPFTVTVDDFYPNAGSTDPEKNPGKPTLPSREGPFTLLNLPKVGGIGSSVDMPGAFITINEGQRNGPGHEPKNLVLRVDLRPQPITIHTAGADGKPVDKTYEVSLRFKRLYKPYAIALKKFSFDRYTGTGTAKNFSSDIVLTDPLHSETREVRISMNKPLRYRGETFFQQGFDDRTEKTTILQIVYNPGYLLPYLAIVIAGFGLIDHFTMVLSAFLLRRSLTTKEVLIGHITVLGLFALAYLAYSLVGYPGILAVAGLLGVYLLGMIGWHVMTRSRAEAERAAKAAAREAVLSGGKSRGKNAPQSQVTQSGTKRIELAPQPRWSRATFVFPVIVLLIALYTIFMAARPKAIGGSAAVDTFARLPVSFDGRIQPMDTLARNALKVLRGREAALLITKNPDGTAKTTVIDPVPWLLDVAAGRPIAREYKTFEIDDLDIKNMMGLPAVEKFFSVNDLSINFHKLLATIDEVRVLRQQQKPLSGYQDAVEQLGKRLSLWNRLSVLDTWYVIPPSETTDTQHRDEWQKFGDLALRQGADSHSVADVGIEYLSRLALTPEGRFRPREASPARWLIENILHPDPRSKDPVLHITNPELIKALALDPSEQWFSVADIIATGDKFVTLLNEASQTPRAEMTPLQQATNDLAAKIEVIRDLSMAAKSPQITSQIPNSARAFVQMLRAHRTGQGADFAAAVNDYAKATRPPTPPGQHDANPAKASFETWYNQFSPFFVTRYMYLGVLLLAIVSWLVWSRPLSNAAISLLAVTVLVHAFGIVGRIYISGRPPVTNLASSAMFIGFGAAVFGLILELLFRNGIGAVAAAMVGFPTLAIAESLSLSGDTMAVLQAVLDTNVWLATHVVTISLGYAATFLAGVLGIIYVIRGVFTKGTPFNAPGALAVGLLVAPGAGLGMRLEMKTLSKMIYGITCFALVMSFVGTILGGIWADQSWGRFWGWDPKENGAILIVLANALVLHARWGGLVKDRGVALLAIFGNIVTAWSWFGTNMLGVGLHSYGFMPTALLYLLLFVGSQFLLILIGGLIPQHMWRSSPASPQSPTPPPLN